MSAPNVWAIREVALASFYDLAKEKAIIQLQNLKSSGIENSGETVYAQGGRGNARIVGFSGNRSGRITLQDAVFTNEVIGMLSGNGIIDGSATIHKRDVKKVQGNKIVLDHTPTNVTSQGITGVYVLNADGTHGKELTFVASTLAAGKYTLTGKEITFNTGELPAGTEVVAYYTANTGADSKKITVSSDKFAGSYKVVLDCLVRNVVDEKDYAAQIVINKAKMEDNWSFSLSSEGDPSVLDIPMEILKPVNTTEMYTMTIYDQEEVA